MNESSRIRTAATIDLVVIGAFLLAIFAPLVDELARGDEQRSPEREGRLPAPPATWSWNLAAIDAWPGEYERHYGDRFGLRDRLLRWNTIVKLFGLGVSPSPSYLLGEDGWIYYADESAREVHLGELPFEPIELDLWRRHLINRKTYLDERGIRYAFVIAPNKETIYPERYPKRMERVGPTRLDQWDELVASDRSLPVLDLRQPLLEEKRRDADPDFTYFPHGTHWQARGSLVAYETIARALSLWFPAIQPSSRDQWTLRWVEGSGDSLAERMYIEDLLPPRGVAVAPKGRWKHSSDPGSAPRAGGTHRTQMDDPALPRLLFVHDSFGPYVIDLLAQHFSQAAWHWASNLDPEALEVEQPDVVVEMFVERILTRSIAFDYLPTRQDAVDWTTAPADAVVWRMDVADAKSCVPTPGTSVRAVVDARGPALEVVAGNSDGKVTLPPLGRRESRELLLMLDVEAPRSGHVRLLYGYPTDPERAFTREMRVHVRAGRSKTLVRIAAGSLRDSIHLWLGGPRQRFLLRKVEARAVPTLAPPK